MKRPTAYVPIRCICTNKEVKISLSTPSSLMLQLLKSCRSYLMQLFSIVIYIIGVNSMNQLLIDEKNNLFRSNDPCTELLASRVMSMSLWYLTGALGRGAGIILHICDLPGCRVVLNSPVSNLLLLSMQLN